MTSTPITVLLVEDHSLIRNGLRVLLEQGGQIAVTAEAASGEEAIEQAQRTTPDVVLMDLTMPGMNGLEATEVLLKERLARRVIVLSGHSTAKWVRRSIRIGARGYVLKTESAENLQKAVMAVHRGDTWFSAPIRQVLASLTTDPSFIDADPLERLSHRQRRVLQLVAEGHTNRGIAQVLGISESTVDTHRTELMRRLGLHDVASVVRFACEEGVVGVE